MRSVLTSTTCFSSETGPSIHQLTAERVSYRASLFSSCLEHCSICLCHTNRNHDVLARTRCHQWSVSAATTVVYLTVDVESSLFFETKLNTLSERRELASTESGPVGKNVCLGLCWRVNDTALGSYKGRGPVTAGRHLVGNLELIRR